MRDALVLAVLVISTIIGVRFARTRGFLKTAKRCDACGRSEPSTTLRFFKNTGMVIMFTWKTDGGQLCRSCGLDLFLKMTLHTVVFGWWGMISFFVNWAFLANNIGNAIWALTLPSTASLTARSSALDEHRDYALNLLATKDRADVIYVLRQQTGASPETIDAWLKTLSR
ncbi:MAG: hypothetical protein QM817_18245 [Archangium sp.]